MSATALRLCVAMGIFLPLLSSMFLFLVVGAEYAALEPKLYWDKILPLTSMPSAIQQHLPLEENVATTVNAGKGGVNVQTGKGTTVDVGKGGVGVSTGESRPGGTTVTVGKGGVGVHTGKGTAVNVGHGGVGVSNGKPKPSGAAVNVGKGGVNVHTGKGTSVNVGHGGVGVATAPKGKPVGVHVNPLHSPFDYIYAASETQLHDDPAAALFFLRNDLRSGKKFTLQLATSDAATSTFIPRKAANNIPFSSSELPSILPRFGIPAGSGEAATMKATLQECEDTPAAGETKRCATSLEDMVDFATTVLGTRDVEVVSMEGGGASAAKRQPYKVNAIRRVAEAGGKGVVACHPEAYVYAVFLCHATKAAEVYQVDLAAADGSVASAKVVAVCHTDTAAWNPKHLAFKVLGVKPGTAAVCHFLPRDHVVWAEKA